METSWEVRKPSKKWRNGIRDFRVAIVAMAAKSWASWTSPDERRAKPIWRHAITSEWSPKIESAFAATVRAATCIANEVSSPAILYMFGIIRRRPCDAVKVEVKAPAWRAPWTAPAAPASDCISLTSGIWPQMFFWPRAAQSSENSPMFDEGVIG